MTAIIGCARTAFGQELTALQFEELNWRLVFGEAVILKENNGHEVAGQLTELTPQGVAIDGRSYRFDGILQLDKREGRDSLKNGAQIGGWVLGVWCALVCGQGTTGGGHYAIAVTTNAIIGAIIGAGIDQSRKGPETVFRRNDPLSSMQSPITLGRGFAATVRWSF